MPIISAHPDGNCAVNAIIIAGTAAITEGQLDNNQEAQLLWLNLFEKAGFIKESSDWNDLKTFISQQRSSTGLLTLQLRLAPLLRNFYIKFVEDHKAEFLTRTKGSFVAAFYSFVQEKLSKGLEQNPDDIYSKSEEVTTYFQGMYEKNSAQIINFDTAARQTLNEQLEKDWEAYVSIAFLDYTAEDGIWLGDLELSFLLPALGFNFHLRNLDRSLTHMTNISNKPALILLHYNFHWYCEVNFLPSEPNSRKNNELLRPAAANENQFLVLKDQNIIKFWHDCIEAMRIYFPNYQPFTHFIIAMFIDFKEAYPNIWNFEFKYFTANLAAQIPQIFSSQELVDNFRRSSDFVEFYDFYQSHKTAKNPTYLEFLAYIANKNTSWDEAIVAANKFISQSKMGDNDEKATAFLLHVQDFLWHHDKRPNSLQASWQAGYYAMHYYALRNAEKNPPLSDIMLKMLRFTAEKNQDSVMNDLFNLAHSYQGKEKTFEGNSFFKLIKNHVTYPLAGKGITAKDLTGFFSPKGELINHKFFGYCFDDYITVANHSLDAVISIWEMSVNTVESLQNWSAAMKFALTHMLELGKIPPEKKNIFLSACQDRLYYSQIRQITPDKNNLQHCWNAGAVALLAYYDSSENKLIKPSYDRAWRTVSQYFKEKMLSVAENQFKEIYFKTENFASLCKEIRGFKFPNTNMYTSNNNQASKETSKEEATPTITYNQQQQ